MKSLVQVFEYGTSQVRTIVTDNSIWFVGKDICEYFGDTNYRRSLARIDDDEKGVSQVNTPGGPQSMTIVNESGLYSLLFSMQPQKGNVPEEQYQKRVEQIRRFKRWVTHEVLPSIRRHGMYATPQTVEAMLQDPDTMIKTLQALKAERERRQELERKVEEDKPRVLFSKAVEASHTSILIGDLAKLLRQNGVQIGQNRLFAWMRDNGYLIKSGSSKNMPTQYSMERGWFEVKERAINNPDGSIRVTKTTKVTGKGQQYFISLFLDSEGAVV